MRMMPTVLGCLAAATLAILPALAPAQTTGKTPSTLAPSKTAAPRGNVAAKAAALAPSAPTDVGAPAMPPAPPAPALEPLPPLPSLPPAASPKAPSPASAPASAAVAPAPAAPALPSLPPAKGPAAPEPATAAAEPLPTAPKPAFPYSGYINADAVRIRSGPGLYNYQLAVLNNGAPVVVENEVDGWLALRPSAGVHGLMKKTDLTVAPDGKKATVSAPAARVYAASDTSNRHWSVMATLKQGDSVQVLGPGEGDLVKIESSGVGGTHLVRGPGGDLVKIVPPEGAHVYVVAQYVQAGTGPGGLNAAVTAMAEPPKVDPLIEDFKKADAGLDAEQKKPLGERDFAAANAAFKEIAEKTDKTYLRRAAEDRMALIKVLERQQAGYLKVLAISDRLDKNLAEIRAQEAAKTAQTEREKKLAKAEFVATGLVAPLESMEDVDYPIKYKLVDQNNHPLVVLKSSAYDLSKYVGKIVGVRGAKTYLKDWRIYLVTVDDLEVIE
jgi:SH3-like domain-containing protein